MSDLAHYVLVVEDDFDIREVECSVLQDAGYDVVGAGHGAIALEHLRGDDRRPCLVLLDLDMPVMDGWTFCDEVAKDPSLEHVTIVVVSAIVGYARGRLRCARAVQHVTKPFDLDQLLEIVATHCRPCGSSAACSAS